MSQKFWPKKWLSATPKNSILVNFDIKMVSTTHFHSKSVYFYSHYSNSLKFRPLFFFFVFVFVFVFVFCFCFVLFCFVLFCFVRNYRRKWKQRVCKNIQGHSVFKTMCWYDKYELIINIAERKRHVYLFNSYCILIQSKKGILIIIIILRYLKSLTFVFLRGGS